MLFAASALLLCLLPAPAAAHGILAMPASRNLKRNWQHCPHCANGGGTWPSSDDGRLRWPRTAQPVCGASDLGRAGAPAATYRPGQVIDIGLFITAHHGGRHVFRLCTDPDASEGCLKEHVLQRADGFGPYAWTSVNGGSAPGAAHRGAQLSGLVGDSYTWRYKLPAGVTCERCVLQWWWTASNSCRVPGAPRWVGSSPGMLSCTEPGPYPEEFRNCADIRIGVGGSGGGGSGGGSDDDARSTDDSWDGDSSSGEPQRQQAERDERQQQQREDADGSSSGGHDHGAGVVASRAQRSAAGRRNAAGRGKELQGGAACKRKSGGAHAYPADHAKFLLCPGGGFAGSVMSCPPGLLWEDSIKACNWARAGRRSS